MGADSIWYGISLWTTWVSCPGCVPSWDHAHPWPGSWGDCAGAVPALLSCSQNTGVLPAPLQLPVYSTALWGLLWRNELCLSPRLQQKNSVKCQASHQVYRFLFRVCFGPRVVPMGPGWIN